MKGGGQVAGSTSLIASVSPRDRVTSEYRYVIPGVTFASVYVLEMEPSAPASMIAYGCHPSPSVPRGP